MACKSGPEDNVSNVTKHDNGSLKSQREKIKKCREISPF